MHNESPSQAPAPGGMSARGSMSAGGVVKTRAPVAQPDTGKEDKPVSNGDNEQ